MSLKKSNEHLKRPTYNEKWISIPTNKILNVESWFTIAFKYITEYIMLFDTVWKLIYIQNEMQCAGASDCTTFRVKFQENITK